MLLIAFAISVVAILGIIFGVNNADPRIEGRGEAVESWLFPLLRLLILVGIVGAVILIIKYAVKTGMREAQNPEPPNLQPAERQHGFPVVTRIPEYSPPTDGPGRYCINGVNRTTKKDATLDIDADSLANAKIKAELDGVIVTSVTKTL
jgi:hypothetical protein